MSKPIIICGVVDMEGNPVKYTKEQQEEFCKKVAGDEYEAIFDETNSIPNLMKSMITDKTIESYE